MMKMNNGTTYGYVRVSTRDQNEARQLVAMKEFGVPNDCVYMDKQSGKDFNRPRYQELVQRLRPNDVLVVKSMATGQDRRGIVPRPFSPYPQNRIRPCLSTSFAVKIQIGIAKAIRDRPAYAMGKHSDAIKAYFVHESNICSYCCILYPGVVDLSIVCHI